VSLVAPLQTGSLLKTTESGLKSSIHRSSWEQIYLPLDRHSRDVVKLLVDGMFARLAEGSGAVALYVWGIRGDPQAHGPDLVWISVAIVGVLMIWLLLTRDLLRWAEMPATGREVAIPLPEWLDGSIEILPGVPYPTYRLLVIAVGLAVAIALYWLVVKTRTGMLIRAGASNRTMAGALGVNIGLLFTLIFGLGAALAGLAGMMAAPIVQANIGMGESILIPAFVVIVVGGIGSIRGAFIAALIVGLIDTMGRSFLDDLLGTVMSVNAAETAAPALSAMAIYILMAVVLFFRPQGLFPPQGRR